MEKRNTILLTVIAVATLLVAVVGATFAYFAGTSRTENSVNLTATTEAANSVFDTTGDTINLNITADKMQVSSPKQVVATNSSDTVYTTTPYTAGVVQGVPAVLTVSYLAGGTTETFCTYNVYYEWQSGKYTKLGDTEFTYQITGAADTFNVDETNFVSYAAGAKQKLNGETKVRIANDSATEPTVQTYTIVAKFYNLELDQSANANAVNVVRFFVDDVQC